MGKLNHKRPVFVMRGKREYSRTSMKAEESLKFLVEKTDRKNSSFFVSLYNQLLRKGYLTPNQEECVNREVRLGRFKLL